MKENEVTCIAFDADDTYLKTYENYRERAVNAVAILIEGKGDEWECRVRANQIVDEIMFPLIKNRLRKHYGVHPMVMEMATLMTATELGLGGGEMDRVNLALAEIRKIHSEDVPELIEGSKEAMEAVKDAGANVIIVTLAQRDWAKRKNERYGINYPLFCFDVLRPKSSQWAEFFDREEIDPANFVIIGDNFWEDIWVPVFEMGARGMLVREKGHVYDYMAGEHGEEIQEALNEGRLTIVEGIWGGERIRAALEGFT